MVKVDLVTGLTDSHVEQARAYGTGLRMLAIPAYIPFMLLFCALAATIESRVSRIHLRRQLLIAVTTWLVQEVLRWFVAISSIDSTFAIMRLRLPGQPDSSGEREPHRCAARRRSDPHADRTDRAQRFHDRLAAGG